MGLNLIHMIYPSQDWLKECMRLGLQVEGFDAYYYEGLDWRKGKNDQNQGMTILDTLFFIERVSSR